MKNTYFVLLVIVTLSIASCEKAFLKTEPSTDVVTVFETFWSLVDENYCFFEEKNVDWNALYALNRDKVDNENTSEPELREVLEGMLMELRDGHVNLYSGDRSSRYTYQDGYPINFNWDLLYLNYLADNKTFTTDETFRSALIDSVVYINITGFGSISVDGETDLNPVSIASQFDELIAQYPEAKGLIIDVRNNFGGNTDNPNAILSRLIKERTLTYYLRQKNGPSQNSFLDPAPSYVDPRAPYYEKQVILLTNRASYSATNYFASAMKSIPDNVTLIGDITGGGAGLPVNKDLPNGWIVRLSTMQLLSNNREQIEEGVEPDIAVDMTEEDIANGKDTILETAIALFE